MLKQKETVISIKTAQRLANLEKWTDEERSSINKCDSDIIQRFKEEEDLTYNG